MGRSPHFLSILVIIILSISLYANTLTNGFVYDDEHTIVKNTLIKDLRNLTKLLDGQSYFALSGEMTYRPIVTITYFIDYSIYGLKPWGFHLTNIILHTANGVLLYILLIHLTPSLAIDSQKSLIRRLSTNPSLLVSLLFIAHPALTEAVNGISFREDLLVFFFYFISLLYYLKAVKNRIGLYIVSWFFLFLALLSKEMAVTLPLTIILIDLYRSADFKTTWRYMGYALIVSFYAYIRFFMFYNSIEYDVESEALSERLLQVPVLLGQHFRLLLFPINLSVEYQKQVNLDWVFIFGLIILITLGISLLLILVAKKANTYHFGLSWTFITLLPVYNIVPIDNPLAERYLYLPMAGFSIVLALLINSQSRYCKTLFTSLILSSFFILAINRNPVWKDDYHLWSDAVKKESTYRAYFKLGKASFDKGRLNDAVRLYLKALSIEPYDPDTYTNLGITYYKQGNVDLAIDSFKRSIWMKYDDATTHYLLGRCYLKKGLLEETKLEYKEALRIAPDFAPAKEELIGLSSHIDSH